VATTTSSTVPTHAAAVPDVSTDDAGSIDPRVNENTLPASTVPPLGSGTAVTTTAGFVVTDGATYDSGAGGMQFSSDGSQLAISDWDSGAGTFTGGLIRLLNTETLQVEQQIPCPTADGGFPTFQLEPLGAEFDADLKRMITAMNSPALSPFGTVRCKATFSPDGDRTVVLPGPPAVVLDVSDGSELAKLDGAYASFSPDSKRVVTGGFETVRVWDATTGGQLAELETLKLNFSSARLAVFSPDGTRIISIGRQGLRIWDADTYVPIATLTERQAFQVAFSSDGTRVAVATFDGASMIDTTSGEELYHVDGRGGEVFWVALSPDDSLLAIGGPDEPSQIFDAVSAKRLAVFPKSDEASFIVFSTDGRTLAEGNQTSVKWWTYLRS
jgi:WD40 repeat protein